MFKLSLLLGVLIVIIEFFNKILMVNKQVTLSEVLNIVAITI